MSKRRHRKRKTAAQRVVRLIGVQLVLMLILMGGLGYYYLGGYSGIVSELKAEAEEMVKQSSPDTFRQAQTSVVYDDKERVISKLKGEKDVYYLTYDEIPNAAKKAIISIEDKKFYTHSGVDYKAIARAVYAMIQNGQATQGASTITQQLARNTFLTLDKTWERKIEEIFVAVALEQKYSKEEILEFYLNNIYFANGYYGIQAASNGYFNCPVDELSLSQTCYLLAIPNSPSYYDPLVHPQNTIERRNRILEQMKLDGVISQDAEERAKAERIVIKRPDSLKNNYVETYIYHCATRLLMEKEGFEFKTEFKNEKEEAKYNEAYKEAYERWNKALYIGGYKLYSSIDLKVQEELQRAIDENLSEFTAVNDQGVYELQGAAVCIDNLTGMVKAIVGGREQNLSGYTLNRGYQSYRQPGSAIKPLIVYTPALERGYSADSLIPDEKLDELEEDQEPSKFVDLRTAVKFSRNAPAWNLFLELTPKVGLSYLKKMGFAKIVAQDEFPAAALGGLTYGVSPLEMAKAYATIENDGYMRDAGCIKKIIDGAGNQAFEALPQEEAVYDNNAARRMTDLLVGVIEEGTAKDVSLGDMPCAGKTGTTNENRDGWFVGYTRYYTTSVWVGYDMPKELPGLTGSSYPAMIWQQFMERMHEGLTPLQFLKPIEIHTIFEEEEPDDEFDYDDETGIDEDVNQDENGNGEVWIEDLTDNRNWDTQEYEEIIVETTETHN